MTHPMTCGTARRLLWPDEGPRRATDDVVRAQSHAAECEACRGFLADMRALADRVREIAPRPDAPPEVRDRLFKAVARARTALPAPRPRTAWIWATTAGLAAAIGLVVGAQVLWRTGPDRMMAAFAEAHLRAVNGEGVETSDSLTVARWLAARLPIGVEVPLFPAARLKGGRLYMRGDRPGAVLEYDLGGRPLSYFVVSTGEPTVPRVGAMPQLHFTARAGYRVVTWQDAGLRHALVADLPEARLADLARYCMHQMMAGVRRPERGVMSG